jgi:hypothetical protein
MIVTKCSNSSNKILECSNICSQIAMTIRHQLRFMRHQAGRAISALDMMMRQVTNRRNRGKDRNNQIDSVSLLNNNSISSNR